MTSATQDIQRKFSEFFHLLKILSFQTIIRDLIVGENQCVQILIHSYSKSEHIHVCFPWRKDHKLDCYSISMPSDNTLWEFYTLRCCNASKTKGGIFFIRLKPGHDYMNYYVIILAFKAVKRPNVTIPLKPFPERLLCDTLRVVRFVQAEMH